MLHFMIKTNSSVLQCKIHNKRCLRFYMSRQHDQQPQWLIRFTTWLSSMSNPNSKLTLAPEALQNRDSPKPRQLPSWFAKRTVPKTYSSNLIQKKIQWSIWGLMWVTSDTVPTSSQVHVINGKMIIWYCIASNLIMNSSGRLDSSHPVIQHRHMERRTYVLYPVIKT